MTGTSEAIEEMRQFEVVDLILHIESNCDSKASQRGFIRRQWTSMICGSPQSLTDAGLVHQIRRSSSHLLEQPTRKFHNLKLARLSIVDQTG